MVDVIGMAKILLLQFSLIPSSDFMIQKEKGILTVKPKTNHILVKKG